MKTEYFCSYQEYKGGRLNLSGCCTVMINNDVADKMALTKSEVAKSINSRPENVVLIAFNPI